MNNKGLQKLCMLMICLCVNLPALDKAQGTGRSLSLSDVCQAALLYKAELKNLDIKQELTEVKLIRAKAELQTLSPIDKGKKLQALLQAADKAKEKQGKKNRNKELPPEVSLRFQIASISDELKAIREEIFYARLSAAAETEQAYYDVLLENKKLAFWANREIETLLQLSGVRRQSLTGAISESEVVMAETEYARAQTEKAKAILSLEAKKRVLGELLGQDISIGFTFNEAIPRYRLSRNDLEPALLIARQHDFSLYQAIQTKKQAETDYTAVLGSKPSIYLQYEKEIAQYIFSCQGQKLDYAVFLQKYHNKDIEEANMWDGKYLFSWMCFQAEGPRKWFEPALITKEVANDRKTAIFSLYLLKNAAKEKYKAVLTALGARINRAYESAAGIEKRRQEINADLSKLGEKIDSLQKKQKLTGREFGTIYRAKLQTAELEEELEENRLLYAKAVSAFNIASCGYLYKPDAAPKLMPAEQQPDACWQLRTGSTERRFSLAVELTPVVYDVDSFQLFYNEELIGEAVVSKPIEAANIPYQPGKDILMLKFYKQGVLRYTASIPSNLYEGVLAMQPNSQALSEYEAAKQKKAALEAEVKKLHQEYLKAVENGDKYAAKSFKEKLDAATLEMLLVETMMEELKAKKTP